MRTSTSVLTIIGLAAVGCATTSPTPVLALGPWGGAHVRMQVTSGGARLEYDCADGVIEEPLRPDSEGWFAATGTHTPGRPGPVRGDETLPSFRARYRGHVQDDQMSLVVTLTEAGTQLGPFELRQGSSGLVVRCL